MHPARTMPFEDLLAGLTAARNAGLVSRRFDSKAECRLRASLREKADIRYGRAPSAAEPLLPYGRLHHTRSGRIWRSPALG